MARIQSPVIGRAKGQAGGMVFTTLNGQNVMKAKAYSYRDQNTLVQQANRAMAATTSRLAASLKGIARSLFVSQPQDMPAYSKLIQQFQAGVDRTTPPYVIEYHGLTIGSGTFDVEASLISYTPATGVLEIDWLSSKTPAGYDKAVVPEVIVIDSESNNVVFTGLLDDELSADSGSATIPAGLSQAHLRIALSFTTTKAGADLQKNVKIFR